MKFEKDFLNMKYLIKNAEDNEELENISKVFEKKHWWSSIFITGLFYGLNGKVSKMILGWLLGWTIIYPIYLIYTSHKDQKEFNNEMEKLIMKRKEEIKKHNNI